MANRRKPVQEEAHTFPPLTCGACSFCTVEQDACLCWVAPPHQIYTEDDGCPVYNRGVPIDGNSPKCGKFEPRMHA